MFFCVFCFDSEEDEECDYGLGNDIEKCRKFIILKKIDEKLVKEFIERKKKGLYKKVSFIYYD